MVSEPIVKLLLLLFGLWLGMQPLLYSEAVAEQGENGWKRVGYNISYHKTSTRHCKALAQEHLDLYTLTWTMVCFSDM